MIIVLAKAIPKDDEAKSKIIDFADDLIKNSKAEDGNVDYNLYDNTKEDFLMFVEQWDSVDILAKHMQTSHFVKFGENIQNLLAAELEISVFDSNKLDL